MPENRKEPVLSDYSPQKLPATASELNYVNQNTLAYDRYDVDTSYQEFEGKLQLPIADADSDPRIVRVHAPYTLKVVRWEIETVCPLGVKPTLPHWDTGDSDDVLCYKRIWPQAPTITPGGNGWIWRVKGEYRYYRKTANESFPVGATPLSIVSAGNFVLTEDDFSEDILDAVDTTPAPEPQGPTNPFGPIKG